MLVVDNTDYPRYYHAPEYWNRCYVVKSRTAHPRYSDGMTPNHLSWYPSESTLLAGYNASGGRLDRVTLEQVQRIAPGLIAKDRHATH